MNEIIEKIKKMCTKTLDIFLKYGKIISKVRKIEFML